jgi:hypothetical protein
MPQSTLPRKSRLKVVWSNSSVPVSAEVGDSAKMPPPATGSYHQLTLTELRSWKPNLLRPWLTDTSQSQFSPSRER